MKQKTNFILKTVHILFWIAFIGALIKTGMLLVSFCISLFITPTAAKNLYLYLDLSALKNFSITYYVLMCLLIVSVTALKAYIAYLVIKIFSIFNLDKPFNANISALITKISLFTLITGCIAMAGNALSDNLLQQGIKTYENWGSSEYIFSAGIIFVVAQVFIRGVELQSENELTI